MKITEEELNDIIQRASNEGARAAIREARRQNKYQDGMDTYKKTEYILRNYREFKRAIADREEEIANIERFGIKKKSCSITSYPGGSRHVSDDAEKAEEQIKTLRHQNEVTKTLVSKVDSILGELKDEPYFEVITMYYMDGKKYEVIAGELGISTYSVSSVRKNLIEKIKIRLLTDEVIKELIGS